ncbi:MAG TPA: 3D-(3,5/4)-trihydroxycyclohexane-1,2-dione acylhydrolase (decyclizing) [Gaiellaceae bacterium]|nr:3D-(3,5/4)-trihydroxycyclohexane-1,2-dione acylhydrolase (decyclizing) [Gaiellaceae bacterium]
MATTIRLTVAQALVRFLAAQVVERDGIARPFFAGCFGIFGHGNVAGVGQALHERPDLLRYFQARNEQAMVHTAVGYARMKNRLETFVCTTSVGPGATNMVTGAALATVNRVPVLLLPSDVFAARTADPVLQQVESPSRGDLSANDSFIPVSRFFDRVERPEQLASAALGALRVLTSQADTGAVTLALPQDVQTEAHDFPAELFERRVWHVPRPLPDPAALARAVELIRGARRPLLVAGGGVIYSEATAVLRALVDATGIPVGETQAGKGSLPFDHPGAAGGIGATGTLAANRLAAEADLVIGVGTRWSDFTTASRSAFRQQDVRFVNVNVAEIDVLKHSGASLHGDARATLERLTELLDGWSVEASYRTEVAGLASEWDAEVTRLYTLEHEPLLAQSAVIGAVNDFSDPTDVVVGAAGSLPGDLHKLWRTRDPKGYHVEYGFSCMGYEIAGGLGVKLAAPEREVYVLVGDGSYLMLAQEIVTSVQEGCKLTILLLDNEGFASIGSLSRSLGTDGFGTRYRYRRDDSLGLDSEERDDTLPVDLAANAASLGAHVLRAGTIEELRAALAQAKAIERTVLIYIPVDRYEGVPGYEGWWDVPPAEVSETEAVQEARRSYEDARPEQRPYLEP